MNDAAEEDWRPTCSTQTLQVRTVMAQAIRAMFQNHGYLEVDTPLLSQDIVVDAWLDPFTLQAADGKRWLQTSPEAHMKRLVASGSGSIFQICRVFRAGEYGRRHNPEFTMVEWYGVGTSMEDQMALTEELVRCAVAAAAQHCSTDRAVASIMPESFARTSYDDAFHRHLGQSVLDASIEDLLKLCENHRIPLPCGDEDPSGDSLLNVMLASRVEPKLGESHPEFLYHYPASQAALAQICSDDRRVARRFELYWNGLELCNGYQELADSGELRIRDIEQNQHRLADGRSDLPGARRLLKAMDHGLPPCSGVALGFDRLVLCALGCSSIRDVIPFPFDRA